MDKIDPSLSRRSMEGDSLWLLLSEHISMSGNASVSGVDDALERCPLCVDDKVVGLTSCFSWFGCIHPNKEGALLG